MLSDVMEYFDLKRAFDHVGYFETAQHTQLIKELKLAIRQGGLITMTGVVGSGKTTALRQLQTELKREKDVIISSSLAVDKNRVNLGTLITALFFDLATERDFKPPSQPERRERKLLELVEKCRKPVVLIVDDAHDLHNQTLVGLKRLIELVQDRGRVLSILLSGHPKLKNDLRRPNLEEIGARAETFTLEGIKGHQQQYIQWLLSECSEQPLDSLVHEDAVALLAEKLMTPLQIEHYLRLAFEEAHHVGAKPITPDIIEAVLSQGINDLEPQLVRHGYNTKILANLLNLRPAEVRSFLHGRLPPSRTQELRDQMLSIGILVS
ncbi:MAG: AAA family ATPase [Leptolyngbya sp. SIO4C1]|nr:AAA family ATPase [Leptolyngbya sp. SIO4C1]